MALKWSDVKVGDRFQMKVTGQMVVVEVVSDLPANEGNRRGGRPGWAVRNLSTGRLLEVRSPARFQGRA